MESVDLPLSSSFSCLGVLEKYHYCESRLSHLHAGFRYDLHGAIVPNGGSTPKKARHLYKQCSVTELAQKEEKRKNSRHDLKGSQKIGIFEMLVARGIEKRAVTRNT